MTVLLFSPFASIWPHTILENQLIDMLSKKGHFPVVRINCGGLFLNTCTVKRYVIQNSKNSKLGNQNICTDCKKDAALSVSNSSVRSDFLTNYVNFEEITSAKAMCESIPSASLKSAEYQDINLGGLALYELILDFKKRTLNLNEIEVIRLRHELTNEILTVLATNRILDEYKPEYVVIFNPQYGIPGAFAQVAAVRGIKTYYISGSGLPSEITRSLKIWDWRENGLHDPAIEAWKAREGEIQVSNKELARAMHHFEYLKSGKSAWSYSTKATGVNVLEKLNIDVNSKITLAVVNSTDEVLAAETLGALPAYRTRSRVFENQIEWIRFLIVHFASKPTETLVIRLHPREFPNKRESVMAEQANQWAQVLSDLPANVIIDKPSLEISIYDYFGRISCVTTGWSSVGLEAAFSGVKVVTYDSKILGYPEELVFSGQSIAEYLKNLETVPTLEYLNRSKDLVVEWIVFSQIRGAILLGGGLNDLHLRSNSPGIQLLIRIVRKAIKYVFPKYSKNLDLKIPRITSDDARILELFLRKKNSLYEN